MFSLHAKRNFRNAKPALTVGETKEKKCRGDKVNAIFFVEEIKNAKSVGFEKVNAMKRRKQTEKASGNWHSKERKSQLELIRNK